MEFQIILQMQNTFLRIHLLHSEFHKMPSSGVALLYCDTVELHLQDSGFYIFCVYVKITYLLQRCQLLSYFADSEAFFLVNGKHRNVKNKSWTVYVFLSAYWIVHQQFHYVSSIVLFLSLPSSFFSLPTSTLEFRVTKIFLLPGGNWPQQRSDFCAVLPCVSMISAVYHPTTWWYSFDSC